MTLFFLLLILLILWAVVEPVVLWILIIVGIAVIIYFIYDTANDYTDFKEKEKRREIGKQMREEYLKTLEEDKRRREELRQKQEEEEEQKRQEELKQKQEEYLKRVEEERRQYEERKKEEELKEIEEKEKEISCKLVKLGAEYKQTDNKIYIKGKDDIDILELLYYGKLLNSTIKGKLPITYEIFDKEDNLITNILYEEIYTKVGHSFVCNIRFTEEMSAIVVKKEFFSDCCYIANAHIFCYIQNRKIRLEEKEWEHIIDSGVANINNIQPSATNIEQYILDILNQSNYKSLFAKEIDVVHNNKSIIINYKLPNKEDFLTIKEYKYIVKSNEITSKPYPENYITKAYENALYSICLRSIYEIYHLTEDYSVCNVTFNGYINHVNRSVGKKESKYILSLSVTREQYNNLEIRGVDPKLCFKSLKGVSASKLADIVAITPIVTFDKNDKRFIESKNVNLSSGTNLAVIEWTEFEQLVRELFELEFSKVGGEVKVTQTSRDGGVDAIIYDPDPLRGGKIVVQAKRYTNTVGVSAVRDLYGTVINEGANSGILITTSDYGHDSYEFAKDKPLKLLNGGHLLGLLEKHGRQAYINIKEAKDIINNNR